MRRKLYECHDHVKKAEKQLAQSNIRKMKWIIKPLKKLWEKLQIPMRFKFKFVIKASSLGNRKFKKIYLREAYWMSYFFHFF